MEKQSVEKSQTLTFTESRDILRQFVREREWEKYHTPRNLILALVGEVGELSQIFEWKGEVRNNLEGFSEKQKEHVGQQLADILNYLIRIADVSGIDLGKAYLDKIDKNRKKYPAEVVKGGLDNYYKLKQEARKQRKKEQQ